MSDRPPLDTNTQLAIERTYLAAERTMMAWVRTAVALIGFGFTIYKFAQTLIAEEHRQTLASPWAIGMTMIVIGLVGLVLAWLQHRQQVTTLRDRDPSLPRSLASGMSGVIALLGVLTLVLVAARL